MKERKALTDRYADCIVDDMDMKTLCIFAKETIINEMDECTDEYVEETIRDFYPHLLEEID